ncbi:hypothetical protein ENSA5_17870 [Enhygromyxa salina]|uniref:DUF4349 domain-containing protein n=1 Tax=Enhygromyxa salina TaxID=215803 RepID=A0A2S9YDQ8_9BACT|nr:DUF4349 domain-containing protein [Enhygromyxa salina]PRQ03243.1 hypothetical protein ENSA5_17870 [Enhygromyxa salina]
MKSNSTHARPRSWLGLLAPAAMIFALGCKSADSTAYPEAHGASELPAAATIDITRAQGSGGEARYDFSEDMAELDQGSMAEGAVMAFAANAPPARDAKGKANKAAQEQRERQAEEAAAKDGEGDDQQPDHGRQIIYIGGLQISVYDLESAMATVEAIPDAHGGWIHMRNQQQVVLRLPALQLKPVMASLAKLGVVEARTLQAQDVSAEYVDLDSRIKVLRETQTQLLELLAKAKTVEEALHVRRALDEVTMELEVALGRMRQLSDLIAFSTLTVTLVERGPSDSIPTSNDPFRWVDSLGVEATEWR